MCHITFTSPYHEVYMIYVQGSSFILLCTKKMGLQWVDCIVFVDFNLFFFFLFGQICTASGDFWRIVFPSRLIDFYSWLTLCILNSQETLSCADFNIVSIMSSYLIKALVFSYAHDARREETGPWGGADPSFLCSSSLSGLMQPFCW